MTRTIVLCADDYAHSHSVSKAILHLASTGRISAISCMAASPLWPEHGCWLADLGDKIDIGLHLTLADEAPLTAMPHMVSGGKLPGIAATILKSYAGTIDLKAMDQEARAQLDAFTQVMGRAPSHIDGHLHAHVLPGLRDITLALARSCTPTPWIRNTADSVMAIARRRVAVPKALLIAGLGLPLRQTARDFKDRMNDSFSGIYAFTANPGPYGAVFGRFVVAPGKRHLIQCHPGQTEGENDAIAHIRASEYKFLNSAAFPEYLARQGIGLGRFAEADG